MADDNTPENPQQPRPRPRFGELAPEGWVWNPPTDNDRLDTGRRTDDGAPTAPARTPGRQKPRATSSRHVPSWNQPVTVLLILVGIIGMFVSIGVVVAIPRTLQLVYANYGLGTYVPEPNVPALMLGAEIAIVAIWVASTIISILLLVRGRLAFYVPLLAGVLAVLAVFSVLTIVVAGDRTLLDFYSSLRS